MIDTLARASGDADENSTKDMNRIVRNLDRLRDLTYAHVMLVHHTGKDTSKGARGSSVLRGAVDTEIELTKAGDVIVAETVKQRDMPSGEKFVFKIVPVVVGQDEDGDDVTSIVIEPSDAPIKARVSGKPAIALQALSECLIENGKKFTSPNYPSCPVVTIAQWQEWCDRHGLSDSDNTDSRRRAFSRAKDTLMERGLVRQFDKCVWKTDA